jgi:hypothetical protein
LLFITGKNFPANTRLKISASRAPATNGNQDFGFITTDSTGAFKERKTTPCTTNRVEDGNERVTFLATDSSGTIRLETKIDGSSWVCQ